MALYPNTSTKQIINTEIKKKINSLDNRIETVNGIAEQAQSTANSASNSVSDLATVVDGKQTQIDAINDTLDTVQSTLSEKQDTLTFDNEPLTNSDNPVKSSGIYNALETKLDKESVKFNPEPNGTDALSTGGAYDIVQDLNERIDNIQNQGALLSNDDVDISNNGCLKIDNQQEVETNAIEVLNGNTKLKNTEIDGDLSISGNISGKVATLSANGLMSSEDKVKLDAIDSTIEGKTVSDTLTDSSTVIPSGKAVSNIYGVISTGTCSTAAATAAKVVTCANWNGLAGQSILITFTHANTASNPTLSINGKGALPIYNGSTREEYIPEGNMLLIVNSDCTKLQVVNTYAKKSDALINEKYTDANTAYTASLSKYGQNTFNNFKLSTGSSNSPNSTNGFIVTNILNSTNYGHQIAYDLNGNNVYTRQLNNGSWTNWDNTNLNTSTVSKLVSVYTGSQGYINIKFKNISDYTCFPVELYCLNGERISFIAGVWVDTFIVTHAKTTTAITMTMTASEKGVSILMSTRAGVFTIIAPNDKVESLTSTSTATYSESTVTVTDE